MRRQQDLTVTRAGSPNRYCNFTVGGHRFRGSLGTGDRETAEIIAAKLRSDALLGKLTGKKPEIALGHALGRYCIEHAQHLASAGNIRRMGRYLIAGIGRHTLLSDITADALSTYVARRRAALANRTVNAEIEHLRAVVRRAESLWGVATPALPWKALLLEEPGEREHVLSAAEEEALFAALRPDYHAMVRFALLTGARRANVIGLTWRQIDLDAGTITWQQKSKKPGGRRQVLPITRTIAAILARERGRHPLHVFTYVCARNRHDRHAGQMQTKGARYPFTLNGWRKEWKRALAEAGIADFRFHDLRHSAATRTLRATGNLRQVQKMLGHSAIASTLRYEKSVIEDLRAAMEAAETTQIRPIARRRRGKPAG